MALRLPPNGDSPIDEPSLTRPPNADAPAEGGATPINTRDVALALAHHIFVNAPVGKEISEMASDELGPAIELGKGTVSGLKRNEFDTSQSIPNQFGQAVGKYGPTMAATYLAGAAAPATAPLGLAAKVGPKLASALTSAAAAGGGAAGGELASAGASKVLGGKAPESAGQAIKEAGQTGLWAAATDLGLNGLVTGIAAAAPRFVGAIKAFPKEILKRTLQRPEEVISIVSKPGATLRTADETAVSALRNVQNGLKLARKQSGQQVESALNQFQSVTKGAPIIEPMEIAASGAEALANRSTSEGVSAITDSEIKKIHGVIKELNESGPLSARDAVVWRRKLDNMIDYGKGAVPEISSGEGQGVIAEMARTLRGTISDAAEKAGFKPLAEANANFNKVANAYDAYRPAFNTKSSLGSEAVRRINSVERIYNQGGLPQADLTEIGKHIPALQKPVDDLLDAIAARKFFTESHGSPSSLTMNAVRFIAGPDGLATATRLAYGKGKTIRNIAASGGAGVGAAINRKEGSK